MIEGEPMRPKPAHLGPDYADQFSDPSVVAAYHLRPPYPAAVLHRLVALVAPGANRVLDLGTGTGAIARGLATQGVTVDALDPSPGMIERGRRLPGGEAPGLRWIVGRAEDAPLAPPYGLITAAASLHWMEWPIVLPRCRDLLVPGGPLALVADRTEPPPWADVLQAAIDHHSTNRDYHPYDLVAELTDRGLFRLLGQEITAAMPFEQPVADYVESFHARNGFSRDRMTAAAAAAFDREVTAILAPHTPDGVVRLGVVGVITWGLPAPNGAGA